MVGNGVGVAVGFGVKESVGVNFGNASDDAVSVAVGSSVAISSTNTVALGSVPR